MIQENNIEDTTSKIRDIQQSDVLLKELEYMCDEQKKLVQNGDKMEKLGELCDTKCIFMKTNQKKLYDKLLEDNMKNNECYIKTVDIAIEMIHILKKIEIGEINQHEGAYEFGKICSKIYVDPIINRKENENLSWEEYKKKTHLG